MKRATGEGEPFGGCERKKGGRRNDSGDPLLEKKTSAIPRKSKSAVTKVECRPAFSFSFSLFISFASMDYETTKNYLYGLRNRGSRYGLERMPPFMRALGNPETRYPVVHVAGTNGKGSVCAIIESILRAGGYKTGLFTSPHLVRLGERVQIDRRILPEEAIIGYTEELKFAAERVSAGDPELHPTFFEFMTAMAFLHFAREEVDAAVVEVGLGGRLDSTNVVTPAVSVITSIGLDHCEQLGDTLARVAGEKAGIVKPGVPVVLGRLRPEAEAPILAVAAEKGCRVYRVADVYGEDPENHPRCALGGDCQRLNAATALLALRAVADRFPVPEKAVETGLGTVEWPGRWQEIGLGGRRLILDATHNEEATLWLDRNLEALRARTGRKPVVLVGALGEVRARALLAVLARHAREIYLLQPDQPRATPFEILESFLDGAFEGPVMRSSVDRIFPEPDRCTVGEEGDTVVLTGSIYLIGEVMERLAPRASVSEAALQG